MSHLIWITGLSGSGKSTLAKAVVARLRESAATVLLDGDEVREALGNELGHGREARLANAYRIARLAHLIVAQDVNVVCATMSLFREVHELNRARAPNLCEVFLDVGIEELTRRDIKGLYAKALRGEKRDVVGVDLAWDRPVNPELVLDVNSGDIAAQVERVLAAVKRAR
jgi:adenylylsulfate kinase-like enzyme